MFYCTSIKVAAASKVAYDSTTIMKIAILHLLTNLRKTFKVAFAQFFVVNGGVTLDHVGFGEMERVSQRNIGKQLLLLGLEI